MNWLNTSLGHPPAYNFTPDGANDNIALWVPSDGSAKKSQNRFRNPNAIYFLPSENEWCKAAYYHPQANSGSGRYWTYARNLSKVGSTVTADITSNQGNVDVYVKFRRDSPRFFRLRAGTIRKKRGNLDDFEESTDFH